MLCSSTCVSGVCLQEDGNCTQGCESSWYGEKCELRCNSNCVNKTCSQTGGTCIKGCKSGWHGSQCDRNCSVNCYDLNCKQSTGECVGACNVGWFGPTCERICSKTCTRHICETNDGNCTYGCDEGFEGQNCQTQITIRVKPQISNPLNYIMIAGSTTLIFLIGVAAACCSRSRNNWIQNIRIWYRGIYKCTLVKDLPSTRNVGDYMQLDLSTCNHEEAYGTLKLSDDAKTRMAARDTFYAVIAMSPDRIRQEFWRLSTDVTKECIVAKLPENISKNSFEDVFPYDENRVVLQAKDGLDNMQPGSDYINASYIRGLKKERQYIAAQGPTAATATDFWRMVWQKECSIIVRLTHSTDTANSDAYIPDAITVTQVGNLSIKCAKLQHYADFTLHEFELSSCGEIRMVRHLQYTRWPERGLPPSAVDLTEFHQKYRAIVREYVGTGPVIVHCTSGAGRTGVFIALDIVVDDIMETGECDVFETVQQLREQRVQMVQLIPQYRLLYEAVALEVALGCLLTSKRELKKVFDRMQIVDTCGKNHLQQSFEDCNASVLMDRMTSHNALQKNKQHHDVYYNTQVYDNPDTMAELHSVQDVGPQRFAVILDSYFRQNALVATQMPTPNTIVDFCHLVIEKRCSTIVMLNAVDKKDKSILQYWFDGKVYENVKMSSRVVQECQTYGIRNVVLEERSKYKTAGRPKSHSVRMIQYTAWDFRKSRVPEIDSFLNIVTLVRRQMNQTPNTPMFVHCVDGSGQCALFCAIYNLIEKVDHERFVNVASTVCRVKARLPAGIKTLEQYKFCYDVVIAYLSKEGVLAKGELTLGKSAHRCDGPGITAGREGLSSSVQESVGQNDENNTEGVYETFD